jgi:hypothetical protein
MQGVRKVQAAAMQIDRAFDRLPALVRHTEPMFDRVAEGRPSCFALGSLASAYRVSRPRAASISACARAAATGDWNRFRRRTMTIELSAQERDLLRKILDSYLSELRQEIAATKRDTATLHAEEDLVKALQRKLAA